MIPLTKIDTSVADIVAACLISVICCSSMAGADSYYLRRQGGGEGLKTEPAAPVRQCWTPNPPGVTDPRRSWDTVVAERQYINARAFRAFDRVDNHWRWYAERGIGTGWQ